uniref:IS66 family transposase n=1 Tax=Thiocapsa sp. TaxID=2024551 RepID=UPI0035946FE3
MTGVCSCGQVDCSAFPDALAAPVQYGPGLSALAGYFTHDQRLPDRRSAQVIGYLPRILLFPTTLVNMGHEAAMRLAAPVAAIGQSIVRSAVAHADETGMRVAGALQWLP